ncbi:YARHG domain-containing protein [Mediterraneibacter glycyrrhizinilyticus]|uniref:YARHG domain-containing protein n=1 Tax=Mediterraneibacter glycyrrhizinilyticus TaxID=342942 RepID=UPI0026590A9E|nr:YARHG domain-containing protein [Mediterraneibacter glycyrrhizinilyticus]MCF2569967.1 YARHG domain-containing protein [Mediterraneibacter glycyrrhizinilyticus]
MSYVLINGKRYYKDDRTGRTTLDNVSQAEADRRTQRNQGASRTTGTYRPQTAAGNGRTTGNAGNVIHTTGTAGTTVHTGFPWKAVIACAVIILFIGAFFYNRSHVSSEEQAITNYMNAEDTDSDDEATTAEEDSASALYLMPDSADRYLEVSDIEGYSRDEIQMIINEIYAKHGREFHTQENIDYFSAQDWYEPVVGKSDEEIANEFNAYEKANVELLCKYR